MALTSAQKTKILRILCYPIGAIDPNSMDYNKGVADRLDYIAGDGQAEVEDLLEKIEAADDKIASAVNQEGVKRIDDIEFFEDRSMNLQSAKRRYVEELSNLTSVPSRCRSSRMGHVCC